MKSDVGFIGLGTMGLPMTRMLAESGIIVSVYDANPVACEEAKEIAHRAYSRCYRALILLPASGCCHCRS